MLPSFNAGGLSIVVLIVGVALVLFGVGATARQIWLNSRSTFVPRPAPLLEKIAVATIGIIGFASLVSIVVIVAVGERVSPKHTSLLALFFAALASPAALWRTRFRGAAEGMATATLGAAIVIAGFSIGPLLVPFGLLTAAGALQNLRARHLSVSKRVN